MNLLSLLLGSMTTQSSVDSLSEKTGVSAALIRKLLPLAIPILLKYLTSNASNQQGALSLLGALSQHTSTNQIDKQIKDADADDGSRILGHILGGSYSSVMGQLARQTGLTESQVGAILAILAPALLSGVSAANTQQQTQQSAGLGSLLGMFGGVAQQPAQDAGKDQDGTSLLSLLSALAR